MQVATGPFLTGVWRMARRVTDPEGRRIATVRGRAEFAPDGAGLTCRERGMLRLDGHTGLAERVTLWRFGADGRVTVCHADGSPFHDFDAGMPEAVHLCGADRYVVSYRFGRDRWCSRWRVTGPAKDQVIVTRYRRPPGGYALSP